MTDRRERQVTGGFPLRLRQCIDAYGSANSIAKAIERSEGAVRKWLRGESEPNVTDLRTLCEKTNTSIEWLLHGPGKREETGGTARGPSLVSDRTQQATQLFAAGEDHGCHRY